MPTWLFIDTGELVPCAVECRDSLSNNVWLDLYYKSEVMETLNNRKSKAVSMVSHLHAVKENGCEVG